MAELGALLGGILAELARARQIADQLTRELVAEYEKDPVLASMSVPRVTMSEVNLTLRFTVDEVEAVPPAEPAPTVVREEWQPRLGEKLLAVLGREVDLDPDERKTLAALVAKTSGANIPPAVLKQAVQGKIEPAVNAVVKPVLAGWNRLPAGLRKKLGNKGAFTRAVSRVVEQDLTQYLKRQRSKAFVEAALASRVKVAVQRNELPPEPSQQQEIQLTLSESDLEIVLEKPPAGGD